MLKDAQTEMFITSLFYSQIARNHLKVNQKRNALFILWQIKRMHSVSAE